MQQQQLPTSSWAPNAQHVPMHFPMMHLHYGSPQMPMFAQQGSYPTPNMSMGHEGSDHPMGLSLIHI
eukprot:8932675-Prorocentrum_lima.AAC.1